MKKKFLATRNAFFRDRTLALGAVCLAVALFLCAFRLIAPELLIFATAPIHRTSAAATGAVGSFFSSFKERSTLVAERDALAKEVDARTARERILTEELADLRRLMGVDGEIPLGAPASVLMRPPVSPYDTFVIDAGTRKGVLVGSLASGPGGVPVGIVEEAGEQTARIVLFSASGRETEGWAGEARTPITLTGEGAGSFSAIIPQDAPINVGDAVIVPGFRGAPVGTVRKIISNPSSPFAELSITPLLNPFSVTWVTVAPYAP